MSRTTARKHSFILIYCKQFQEDNDREDIYNKYLESVKTMEDEDLIPISSKDEVFIKRVFYGTLDKIEELNELIKPKLTKWKIERIAKVDLAILQLSLYEILYENDIPERVSVNEAVELAKVYSGDDSPKFINGVLGKILSEKEE